MHSSPDLSEILHRMVDRQTELENRVLANELITAKLISELTKTSADPEAHMLRVTSEISGLADRLATITAGIAHEDYDPAQITRYLYRLCDMAEGQE